MEGLYQFPPFENEVNDGGKCRHDREYLPEGVRPFRKGDPYQVHTIHIRDGGRNETNEGKDGEHPHGFVNL